MADAIPHGCSQIFAPCLDPHCQRPCGARRTIPEINLDTARHSAAVSIWTLAAIWLALTIIFAGAAAYGLPRAEQAYQEARV